MNRLRRRRHEFFAAGDIAQVGSGQPFMVVNEVGDGKRVAFNLDEVLRGVALELRSIPVDVIFDLNRMNMTYFPHFPRVQQELLPPKTRKKTQDEVIQAYTEEQAVEEASRCFSCGTCNACDNCYLVCPSRASFATFVRTACTRFWWITAKAAACVSKSARRAAWRACRSSTSIQAWSEWIPRSRFRRDCTAGKRKS